MRRLRESQPYKWKDGNFKRTIVPLCARAGDKIRWVQTKFKEVIHTLYVFFIVFSAIVFPIIHTRTVGAYCDALFFWFMVKLWVSVGGTRCITANLQANCVWLCKCEFLFLHVPVQCWCHMIKCAKKCKLVFNGANIYFFPLNHSRCSRVTLWSGIHWLHYLPTGSTI